MNIEVHPCLRLVISIPFGSNTGLSRSDPCPCHVQAMPMMWSKGIQFIKKNTGTRASSFLHYGQKLNRWPVEHVTAKHSDILPHLPFPSILKWGERPMNESNLLHTFFESALTQKRDTYLCRMKWEEGEEWEYTSRTIPTHSHISLYSVKKASSSHSFLIAIRVWASHIQDLTTVDGLVGYPICSWQPHCTQISHTKGTFCAFPQSP